LASAHLLLSLSRSPHPPRPTLFPYTTLFRSVQVVIRDERDLVAHTELQADDRPPPSSVTPPGWTCACGRSAGPAPLSTATPAVTTMTPPESSSGSSGWEQAASSAISTTGTRTFSKRMRPRPLHSGAAAPPLSAHSRTRRRSSRNRGQSSPVAFGLSLLLQV